MKLNDKAILVWIVITIGATAVGSAVLGLGLTETGYFSLICSAFASIFTLVYFKGMGGKLEKLPEVNTRI
jgi:hypothetical protein